ncbi:GNAT family N-acetyltransferase [Frondihabitans australicus]|uniref:RimJ/RimL family protein N-acetyltransferase n=1 Tax=Frondihabitans australicus TaxID=386892 RepID=A0A495ILA5_9MICO|nr:GNAT family N-acetyltransferase [Frondihabitans australicus]RKR75915.1 RimJ/RimL family protein N-acetyltransferase [Frondihabitans australicus]
MTAAPGYRGLVGTETTRTSRLLLQPMGPGDGPRLFALFSEPDVWWYNPAGLHADVGTTESYATRAGGKWDRDGLSYWVAVLAHDPTVVIGTGGVQLHGGGHWNLNYRVAPTHQRQGFAAEIARAGIEAARAVDTSLPVVAWIDHVNAPSIATALRVGLHAAGEGVDPSDGSTRLAFTDRNWIPA